VQPLCQLEVEQTCRDGLMKGVPRSCSDGCHNPLNAFRKRGFWAVPRRAPCLCKMTLWAGLRIGGCSGARPWPGRLHPANNGPESRCGRL